MLCNPAAPPACSGARLPSPVARRPATPIARPADRWRACGPSTSTLSLCWCSCSLLGWRSRCGGRQCSWCTWQLLGRLTRVHDSMACVLLARCSWPSQCSILPAGAASGLGAGAGHPGDAGPAGPGDQRDDVQPVAVSTGRGLGACMGALHCILNLHAGSNLEGGCCCGAQLMMPTCATPVLTPASSCPPQVRGCGSHHRGRGADPQH